MKRQNGKEPCVQKIFGIIIAAGDVLINFTVISQKFATLDKRREHKQRRQQMSKCLAKMGKPLTKFSTELSCGN